MRSKNFNTIIPNVMQSHRNTEYYIIKVRKPDTGGTESGL